MWIPHLFNFHGGGGTATGHRYYSDLRPIADTANFIAVYPQGSLLSDGGGTHWNSAELSSSNKNYSDVLVSEEMDFTIWGVCTYVIHALSPINK